MKLTRKMKAITSVLVAAALVLTGINAPTAGAEADTTYLYGDFAVTEITSTSVSIDYRNLYDDMVAQNREVEGYNIYLTDMTADEAEEESYQSGVDASFTRGTVEGLTPDNSYMIKVEVLYTEAYSWSTQRAGYSVEITTPKEGDSVEAVDTVPGYSDTVSPTPTISPTLSPTPTISPSPTVTPVPTKSPTPIPTQTPANTVRPTTTLPPVSTVKPTATPVIKAGKKATPDVKTVAAKVKLNKKGKKVTITKGGSGTTITVDTVLLQGKAYPIEAIGAKAYANKKKLDTVIFKKSVRKIGKNAFLKCKKLRYITFESAKVPKIEKGAFQGIHKKVEIYVPKKAKKKYIKALKKAGCYWKGMEVIGRK